MLDLPQSEVSKECLRLFDGELVYTDKAVNMLLRAVQGSSVRQRQVRSLALLFHPNARFLYRSPCRYLQFIALARVYVCLQVWFEHVMGCRRRLRRKWEETSLSVVFALRSEFHLLKQRAHSMRVRWAVQQRKLSFFDSFCLFDCEKNGRLSPGVLWAALDWLGVPTHAADVIDLMRTCDMDGDRMLGWSDYALLVRCIDGKLDELDQVRPRASSALSGVLLLYSRACTAHPAFLNCVLYKKMSWHCAGPAG